MAMRLGRVRGGVEYTSGHPRKEKNEGIEMKRELTRRERMREQT